MRLLNRVLDPPRYGFEKDGKFYRPSTSEILREFFWRLNLMRTRKNWLCVFGWVTTLSFALPLALFITQYFTLKLFALGFVYSMVILGSHGTFWLHRYSTHRAFKIPGKIPRLICRNLVIKIVPEETYVVSHHVHHHFSEKAGDPYNVNGGWLYCFLADVIHQPINKNLSESDYAIVCKLLQHTGVKLNSYEQYQKWGSATHPLWAIGHYVLNWSFWYGAFYLMGGTPLAIALFGMSGVWAVGIRTFNYDGHGRGKDKRRKGIDFNWEDLSINQPWPGYVAGEWHNNHHLYPNGARSGFLDYQLDLPWLFIKFLSKIGWVEGIKDYKEDFERRFLSQEKVYV